VFEIDLKAKQVLLPFDGTVLDLTRGRKSCVNCVNDEDDGDEI